MMRKSYLNLLLWIILIFPVISGCGESEHDRNRIKKGDFRASITESGELQAIRFKPILMPFIGWKYGWRFKIIELEEHGARVGTGDTVARMDPSTVISTLEEEKNKLETEEANLKKLYATHKSELAQVEAERESEKANFELIKLQVEKFRFEPENKQKLKALELQIAEEKLKQIARKYEMLQEVNRNDIQIQQVKIEQIKRNIREAELARDRLIVVSPIEGIYQLQRNRRTRNMVQIGDEIHQGQLIASIPDMSKMKVISSVNETDISKLHLKQEVIIRLDAYPEKPFPGHISYIGKISHEKENDELLKVFDIEATLNEADPVLKPGMTVSCEIITHELSDVYYIENECIFQDSVQYYLLGALSGKKEKINIEILARNNLFSAVKGDFKEGQKFLDRDELKESDTQ